MTAINIIFKRKNEFQIDDVSFVVDISPGYNRRPSEENSFTIVKTKRFIDQYIAIAKEHSFSSVLELGIFQGGSYVFFDKIFRPTSFSAVDISKHPVDPLINYIASERNKGRNLYAHFSSSQDDINLLDDIYRKDLNSKVDLIIDDASHRYDLTKKSFEYLFPLLEPEGMYIIEDWAWGHAPGYQAESHPWYNDRSLTHLLFEVIISLGCSNHIENIFINKDIACIKKSAYPSANKEVINLLRMRNKSLSLI